MSGEGQRGKEKDSEADCALSMEPDVGPDPTTTRSWPVLKPTVGRLAFWATQVPLEHVLFGIATFRSIQ